MPETTIWLLMENVICWEFVFLWIIQFQIIIIILQIIQLH
jgi:hypothetical protein